MIDTDGGREPPSERGDSRHAIELAMLTSFVIRTKGTQVVDAAGIKRYVRKRVLRERSGDIARLRGVIAEYARQTGIPSW